MADLLQPVLAPPQLLDLLLQLRLGFEYPLVAHSIVLGGIGLHLGAVQRHMAQADHAGRLAEAQDLNEQLAQGLKIAAPELTDPSVLWLLVAGKYPKCQILVFYGTRPILNLYSHRLLNHPGPIAPGH